MTTHRHLDSTKHWTSTVTDPDLGPLTARVTALEAALAKLGGLVAPPVVPPVVPPTVPTPTVTATVGDGVVSLSWS